MGFLLPDSLSELRSWSFRVAGTPIPQGSKTRSASGHFYEANKNHGGWRKTVTEAARSQVGMLGLDEPVAVIIEFWFAPPKKPRFGRPAVKPDIDKLCRSVLDSLTVAGVWVDDSRVVELVALKFYGEPGVRVKITKL